MEKIQGATANRRQYLLDKFELINFSNTCAYEGVEGVKTVEIGDLPEDIVSVGKKCLRVTASENADGTAAHHIVFKCNLPKATDLTKTATINFNFSAYDGEHDSLYFKEMSENKYFVEKPDPLVISHSKLIITLLGGGKSASRITDLTNYGFNRIYANFAGEEVLSGVEAIELTYNIEEPVPGWQRVCKLDTVFAGVTVDYNLAGGGLDRLFSGASVTHANSVVKIDFKVGETVEFPTLENAAETIYDIWLPVKNTIIMRLKSSENEANLKLWFKNDVENFYSEDKTKTFAVSGLNEAKAHYFNISDNAKAVGRLTGFKLTSDKALTLEIYKVQFEQEKILKAHSGKFTAVTAEKNADITFECDIKGEFAGKKLAIYDIFGDVIHPDPKDLTALVTADIPAEKADIIKMTIKAPLMKGKTSRMAYQFWAAVIDEAGNFTDFEERGIISNWRELCEKNPYEFTLADNDFNVIDFGAVGDGFTDDTDALQKAIDAASVAGGRVVIPGDDSFYGKRYIITNIRMRSHVELHICENAVLWQADDPTLYKITPRFGHNVSMTGVNWPANHSSGNYPMIYSFRENHIKITGPGMIRMCDTESHSEDGLFKFIGDNVCIGCCDRMHVLPVAIVECEDIEVTDLKIIRSSAVYMNLNNNKRGFFGNVYMDEAKCTGADGMWPCGSDGMYFTRIMLNTNDDGLCLSSNYNDPRDMLWVYSYPGYDHGTHHITLSHSRFSCYTFTASAISFCTWGTDAPDLDRVQVSDINIFDNVLEGRVSLGGWTDNPYYGKVPFDGSETDDFSPVNNVKVFNNELRSPLGIALRATNFETDCGFKSPANFEYGNFERRPAEQNPGWRAGLSNWSYASDETVRQVILYEKSCAALKPNAHADCNLWQGLYLTAGHHIMSFKYKAGGEFNAFAELPDGTRLNTASFSQKPGGYHIGHEWQNASLEFDVKEEGIVRAGVEGDFRKLFAAYVTDFEMA